MNDAMRKRRVDQAAGLVQKFKSNPRMIERAVFQDKIDILSPPGPTERLE